MSLAEWNKGDVKWLGWFHTRQFSGGTRVDSCFIFLFGTLLFGVSEEALCNEI